MTRQLGHQEGHGPAGDGLPDGGGVGLAEGQGEGGQSPSVWRFAISDKYLNIKLEKSI